MIFAVFFYIALYFAQANVSTLIRKPFTLDKTVAHATRVAPVVNTSSINKTCFPSSRAASGVKRKSDMVFSHRS